MASFVQYNGDNGFGSPSWANLTSTCKFLVKQDATLKPIESYGRLNKALNKANGFDCTSYKFSELVDYVRNTTWPEDTAESSLRTWLWQTCYEFAYFQTSSGENHPFGSKFPISTYEDECYEIYDEV